MGGPSDHVQRVFPTFPHRFLAWLPATETLPTLSSQGSSPAQGTLAPHPPLCPRGCLPLVPGRGSAKRLRAASEGWLPQQSSGGAAPGTGGAAPGTAGALQVGIRGGKEGGPLRQGLQPLGGGEAGLQHPSAPAICSSTGGMTWGMTACRPGWETTEGLVPGEASSRWARGTFRKKGVFSPPLKVEVEGQLGEEIFSPF